MSTKRTRFDALSEELFPEEKKPEPEPEDDRSQGDAVWKAMPPEIYGVGELIEKTQRRLAEALGVSNVLQPVSESEMQKALDLLTDEQKQDAIKALQKREKIPADGVVGPLTAAVTKVAKSILQQPTICLTVNGVPFCQAYGLTVRSLETSTKKPSFGGSFLYEVAKPSHYVTITFETKVRLDYYKLREATEVALVIYNAELPQAYRLRIEDVTMSQDAQGRTISHVTALAESI